jgi:peptidoglycan-associated lipoprotein
VVTVEGFADPAGSTRYNRQLGKRRADGVRDYLVTTGGLPAGQVRTVSYGEDANRLVVPGGVKDAGLPNRRVSLVIDAAGSQASTMPATPAPAPEQPSPPQPEQQQPTSPPST